MNIITFQFVHLFKTANNELADFKFHWLFLEGFFIDHLFESLPIKINMK